MKYSTYLPCMILFSTCLLSGAEHTMNVRHRHLEQKQAANVGVVAKLLNRANCRSKETRDCTKFLCCLGGIAVALQAVYVDSVQPCVPWVWQDTHDCLPVNANLSNICVSAQSSICFGPIMLNRKRLWPYESCLQLSNRQDYEDYILGYAAARSGIAKEDLKASHCLIERPCIQGCVDARSSSSKKND